MVLENDNMDLKYKDMKNLRNKVQLIGFLGVDAEFKTLSSGTAMAKLSLGTSETYKDASGERVTETQWHNVVIWGKLAELVNEYTSKGSEIALEGKLVNRSYEDKAGNKKYVTEVIASEVLFLSNNKKSA